VVKLYKILFVGASIKILGFDLDLLFKVTEVKFLKYTQCDTTSQLLPTSPSTFHIGYIWREFSMSHAIWVAPIMSPSLLTIDSWIVCGWIVSLAQTFLHCKTFSSDVAKYRICKATFYSTQQWIGPLISTEEKILRLKGNTYRKPQGETV
jgi:hypothetical protein